MAHSQRVAGGRRVGKGRVLTADDLAALADFGLTEITVARLDPTDVAEDAAATRLALALVPDEGAANLSRATAFTGRVNLNAACPGILQVDTDAVHALNAVDPAITLATLAPYARVSPGMLSGTVKIISYAVSDAALQKAEAIAHAAIRVLPVLRKTAGLIMTEVPGQEPKLNEKGRKSVAGRLRALGIDLAGVVNTAHDMQAIASALVTLPGDIVLILTGSATSDLYDTAPQAVRHAGGQVARFGMPVDPGNLLFHGMLGARPVIGLPGCARSPALNGADWVLERMACGLTITDADIAGMGVGGLLKEIATRPQRREPGDD